MHGLNQNLKVPVFLWIFSWRGGAKWALSSLYQEGFVKTMWNDRSSFKLYCNKLIVSIQGWKSHFISTSTTYISFPSILYCRQTFICSRWLLLVSIHSSLEKFLSAEKMPYHPSEMIPTKWKPPIFIGQFNTHKIILPNYYKRIQMLVPTFSQCWWTRADLWNTLAEPWYKGNFSSNDTPGFPSGSLLSLTPKVRGCIT